MKVGILTLPFHSNFGYLMQAYALQQAVRKLGHEPYTLDMREQLPTARNYFNSFVGDLLRNKTLKNALHRFRNRMSAEQFEYINRNTREFIDSHISLSPYISSIRNIAAAGNLYDAYIVGSDQVWRKAYSQDIPSFFFDFLPSDKPRSAYAASFGIGHNDYSRRLTEKCTRLLAGFRNVGVREDSGKEICEKVFGKEARKVLDPTLLLEKEDYEVLIAPDKSGHCPRKPYMLCYILDPTEETRRWVVDEASRLNLEPFFIKPPGFDRKRGDDIDAFVYPHVATWLEAFRNAEAVLTDSFHGTVFSIIFNRNFHTLINPSRGASRITSLLDGFGLCDRIVAPGIKVAGKPVDYIKVNELLSMERRNSYNFLKSCIDG